jgi:thymidylate kinase
VSESPVILPFMPTNDGALSLLEDVLHCLPADSVILLRPVSTTFCAETDDVDLLLTHETRETLLQSAFDRAAKGQLHLRIQQNRSEKIRLTLWNHNATLSVTIDLWSAVTQFGPWRNSLSVSAEDLLLLKTSAVSNNDRLANPSPFENVPSVCRLAADIEFCIYVLHIAAKRKDLQSHRVRGRLLQMRDRIRTTCDLKSVWLARTADRLMSQSQLAVSDWVPALHFLEQRLVDVGGAIPTARPRQIRRRVAARLRRWLLQTAPTLTVSGCDGIGKTSLLSALSKASPTAHVRVAKKLYRRSLTYQLLGGALRRAASQTRCEFDDRVAPLIAIRSAAALGFSLCMRSLSPGKPRVLMMDRAVADALVRDRKTDDPILAKGAVRIESFVAPTISVLLVADWDTLRQRKQEMTESGSRKYQQLLFLRARRSPSCDQFVFSNTSDLTTAMGTLHRCLTTAGVPLDGSVSNRPPGEAAIVATSVERSAA